MTRIEAQSIDDMQAQTQAEQVQPAVTPVAVGPLVDDPISETISFEEFAKIDLRVVEIMDAQAVEGADKLLQLTLDLGGETRKVFAGHCINSEACRFVQTPPDASPPHDRT